MATQKVKINMIFFAGLNYSIDTENLFKVGTHSEKKILTTYHQDQCQELLSVLLVASS